ncbi:MAG: hypothetical protein N3G80_00845 [Candidatus Micrarchaeota archaeon]|nr:hypothetical protein [Candidatus Micrarchaeota archaeon]
MQKQAENSQKKEQKKAPVNIFLDKTLEAEKPLSSFLLIAQYVAKKEADKEEIKKAIKVLEKHFAFDLIESIASYSQNKWGSIVAMEALARNEMFEQLTEALFFCRERRPKKYGIMLLIRNGQLHRLYNSERNISHHRQALIAINEELKKIAKSAIERKDKKTLSNIAAVKLHKAGITEEERQDIKKAIQTGNVDALARIVNAVLADFEEMKNRCIV